MPRVGLNGDAVVDAALAVVDESGPQALTLATVAARVGVATPSLYQHVAGLAQLRARVAARVLAEMTDGRYRRRRRAQRGRRRSHADAPPT